MRFRRAPGHAAPAKSKAVARRIFTLAKMAHLEIQTEASALSESTYIVLELAGFRPMEIRVSNHEQRPNYARSVDFEIGPHADAHWFLRGGLTISGLPAAFAAIAAHFRIELPPRQAAEVEAAFAEAAKAEAAAVQARAMQAERNAPRLRRLLKALVPHRAAMIGAPPASWPHFSVLGNRVEGALDAVNAAPAGGGLFIGDLISHARGPGLHEAVARFLGIA